MKKIVIGIILLGLFVGCSSPAENKKVYDYGTVHGYGQITTSLELEENSAVADRTIGYINKENMAELQFYFHPYEVDFELIRAVYQTSLESVSDTWDVDIEEVKLGDYDGVRLSGVQKEADSGATRWIFQDSYGIVHVILFKGTKAETAQVIKEVESTFQFEEFSQLEAETEILQYIVGDVKYIGDSNVGFVEVPDNWVEFQDIVANDDYQYSDVIGDAVVTLNVIEAAEIVNGSPKSGLEAIAEAIKNEPNVTLYSLQETTINGYQAYELRAYYSDIGKGLIIVLFTREDGKVQYIALESSPYMMKELEKIVFNSYKSVID